MLLTVQEYADLVGLKRTSIYSAINRGKIEVTIINGIHYIDDTVKYGKPKEKHNDVPKTKHPLYKVFYNMKTRCYNEKCDKFFYYGGRGIKICDEWLSNPEEFIKWGMAHGYRKGLQIDRINSNGNYEPSNCRFVTPTTNARNRRKPYEYTGTFEDHDNLTKYEIMRIEDARKKFIERAEKKDWGYAMGLIPRDIFNHGFLNDLIKEYAEKTREENAKLRQAE